MACILRRLGEGRQPWRPGQLAQPEAELADHESGLSALDVAPQGDAAVAGTEQGTVALWDLRSLSLTAQARWPACLILDLEYRALAVGAFAGADSWLWLGLM